MAALPPAGTPVAYVTHTTYNPLDRPTQVTWSPVAGAVATAPASVTFSHGYNAANQRVSQGTNDNTWLQYPSGAGTTAYTANALNQYTAIGALTPTYDNNGNLTFDGSFTFGYDVENRLVSATGAGNTVTYAYDAQGRRKRKTVNGTSTIFVTDVDNREVLEYNGSTGQVQAWYAYGGQGEVLNRMDVLANTRQTLIPDIQGSVIATLDSATGSLSKRGYLPYGESLGTTGSFAYTGLRIDPETNGLYYARARMYSPTLGRFLQTDPIGYAGGGNLYAYVGNDPINWIDRRGLAADKPNQTAQNWGNQPVLFACAIACPVLIPLIPPAINAAAAILVRVGVRAAAVAILSEANSDDPNVYAKPPKNAYDPNGPKAPGKPPAEAGFEDPKGGENWVPNPNPGKGGNSHGWQDASGDVWIPTGRGSKAHGGPHWDIQTPGGGYRQVRPPKP